MNQHNVRSKYSPRIGVVVECGEEGGAQQHFKDACDINKIAKMVEATGSAEHLQQARQRYGDFTEIMDLGVNLDKAAKAQQLFEQTPVALRKKVGNSIQGLFEYIQNPENLEDCYKMGIYDRPKNVQKPVESVDNSPAPQSTKAGNLKKTKVQPQTSDTEE